MGVTVCFEELLAMENKAIEMHQEWYGHLSSISSSVLAFCQSTALTGEGAEVMKAYMFEVHKAMTDNFITFLQEMVMKMTTYVAKYFMVDGDAYAILDSATLTLCSTMFNGFMGNVETEIAAVSAAVSGITDLYSATTLTDAILDDDMQPIVTNADSIKTQIEDIDSTENSGSATDLVTYKDTIANMLAAISEGNSVSIDDYVPGEFLELEAYRAAESRKAESLEYIQLNEESYTDGMNMVCAANAYVAAVEARKTEAIIHGIEGVTMVIAGVTVIVATWGMATPVVVGGAAVGGTSIAFGLSETTESVSNIYYYVQEDGTSVAFNPIRDTYFAGDQEKYDVAKEIVSTVTDLYTCGATSYTAFTKMDNLVINQLGQEVIENTGEDAASYVANQVMKEYVTGQVQDVVSEGIGQCAVETYSEYYKGEEATAMEEYLIGQGVDEGVGYVADFSDEVIDSALESIFEVY